MLTSWVLTSHKYFLLYIKKATLIGTVEKQTKTQNPGLSIFTTEANSNSSAKKAVTYKNGDNDAVVCCKDQLMKHL